MALGHLATLQIRFSVLGGWVTLHFAQINNVITFSKMFNQPKEPHNNERPQSMLRAFRAAVMKRTGAKQSSKYWGKTFPSLDAIATSTSRNCDQILEQISKDQFDFKDVDALDRMQKCILVSCQVLMAPMRGKPFWSLSLKDDGKNSMLQNYTREMSAVL